MLMLSGCQYEVFSQVNRVLFTMLSDARDIPQGLVHFLLRIVVQVPENIVQGTPHSPFPFL